MKSWDKEALLIFLCFAVITTSVYALYREMTLRIEKNSSQSIGSITFKKKSAERKYDEYVIWEDIDNNALVFNYDSIRTFKGSAAFIHLKSGTEISLDEDTMIVIISDDDGVKINFDRGSVSAKSGDAAENISLNTKDVSVSMNKGEINVKQSEDIVDVNISGGEAAINAGGDIKKIDENVKAQIVKGKTEVKKISIIPEYPSDNAFFVTYKELAGIDFKWKSESAGTDIVQISKESNFTNIIYTSKSSNGKCGINISPGDYYWKVTARGESSPVKKFILLKDSVPEQIYPGDNEKVSVTGDEETVNFKWNQSEHAAAYEFEVAQNQTIEKPFKKLRLNMNSVSVEGIPAGHLWWRVNRIYPDGFIILDDKTIISGFNLERSVFTRIKPKPIHDGEMYASTLTENIILNWEGGKGVKDYKVEISSDNQFKNIIRSSNAEMPFFNAGKMSEGRYFWRVSANYEKWESPVSDAVTLIVSAPKPVVYLSPVNGTIFADNEDYIKFLWNDPLDTNSYSFEISADSDFKNIISSSKTDLSSYLLKNPGSGKFYWRVSIIDNAGTKIAAGAPGFFFIPEALEKPSAVLPSNMGVINLDNLDVVRFQWNKVTGADQYEVEIFQRESGADRSLIVLNTDKTVIELRNFSFFDQGTVVWIVRARKSVKGKITATSESDRNYFVLKINDNLSAPKPGVSGTIYVR